MEHGTIDPTARMPPHTSVPQKPLPALPTETWLQILEGTQNVELLWTSVRLVSKQHKAFVERVVVSHFLPRASISLSLPRRDPNTGALLYRGQIPNAELSVHYVALRDGASRAVFKPNNVGREGASIESLTRDGALSKERLLHPTFVWLWFGGNRAKGVAVKVDKNIEWDKSEKTWMLDAEWRELIGAYAQSKADAQAKHASRTGNAGTAARR